MWQEMLTADLPLLEKVVRTVLVYVLIVVLFRMSGKRGLANLNTFDFVVIFLLSNAVQNAIIGEDYSFVGGVVSAVTLVLANAAVNRWLTRDERIARLLEGTPTTVIKDGQVVDDAVRRLALRSSEVGYAVRLQTGGEISGVSVGWLEPDGRLVIEPEPSSATATRADITALGKRLDAIEELLRPPHRSGDGG